MILGDAKPEAATQAKHYYVKRPGGCDFTVSLQAAERDPARMNVSCAVPTPAIRWREEFSNSRYVRP